MVSLVLVLPAGSALDPEDRPGLASLTADMLDEGSGDRSAIEMQEALARIGADSIPKPGPDSVVLSLSLLDRFVPLGLQLLSDIVVRPRLGAADFERVRTLRDEPHPAVEGRARRQRGGRVRAGALWLASVRPSVDRLERVAGQDRHRRRHRLPSRALRPLACHAHRGRRDRRRGVRAAGRGHVRISGGGEPRGRRRRPCRAAIRTAGCPVRHPRRGC